MICQNVDVKPPQNDADAEELARQLEQEFSAEKSDAFVVRRAQGRYVLDYVPADFTMPKVGGRIASPWREQGVYLITGGLSGIGLALAEYFGHNYAARLILTRRSNFPPREEWNDWFELHPEDRDTGEIIRKLRRIEIHGEKVLALQADVSDESRMREVLSMAHQTFGALNGLIHSAGVPGG